jgi:hypothetical protein
MGAVLAPAVSGALRDATGAWTAAVFLDAGLIAIAVLLLALVREAPRSSVLARSGRFDRERARVGTRCSRSLTAQRWKCSDAWWASKASWSAQRSNRKNAFGSLGSRAGS